MSVSVLLVSIGLYIGLLFLLARWGERRSRLARRLANRPEVYALALGVYCTSWTFFGSVGVAAREGMRFLPTYLGPTFVLVFGLPLLQRVLRLKEACHTTSVADFISTCYGKSQGVAALVAALLVPGLAPYVALQLRSVTQTSELLVADHASSQYDGVIGPIVVAAMIAFTIVFGLRRLAPTERHPGMMFVIAVESLVKLGVAVVAGLFFVFVVFDGPTGFLDRLSEGWPAHTPFSGGSSATEVFVWLSGIPLAACAFTLLPRQFHVAIVENVSPRHASTASWMTPSYYLLITLFVLPAAFAGLALDIPSLLPDTYVLGVPLALGADGVAFLVFLGGFSAATGMIIVETMAISTMVTNHLVLPLAERTRLRNFVNRHLLGLRWATAALFITTGYLLERLLERSLLLVEIGSLSFAAVAQLAPATLGGLLWKRASRFGAYCGISTGATVWVYTLLLPALSRGHLLSSQWLDDGPFGWSWLRPEALFGIEGGDALTHGVLWSLGINALCYVLGSLAFESENALPSRSRAEAPEKRTISAASQRLEFVTLLAKYHEQSEALRLVDAEFAAVGVTGHELLSPVETVELQSRIERRLAGIVGAATAHAAIREVVEKNGEGLSRAVAESYARTLAAMRITPEDLRQRVNYQRERLTLLREQADQLRSTIAERDREITVRKRAEAKLRDAQELLEDRVRERTADLRLVNTRLRDQVEERERAERELVEMQEQLVRAAHLAGRAEVASNVLHNVGNALNSMNISVSTMGRQLTQSKGAGLARLAELLEFPEGQELHTPEQLAKLAMYARKLGERLELERGALGKELSALEESIEHVKQIIRVQQSYARQAGAPEDTAVVALLADALRISGANSRSHGIAVEQQCPRGLVARLDKHRVLEILTNLLANAKQALADREPGHRMIDIRVLTRGDELHFEIEDNGVGISADNLTRIFQHGFTTKKDGHGFGLHGASVSARAMGGRIDVHSEGEGRGARFTLVLPSETREKGGVSDAAREVLSTHPDR